MLFHNNNLVKNICSLSTYATYLFFPFRYKIKLRFKPLSIFLCCLSEALGLKHQDRFRHHLVHPYAPKNLSNNWANLT